MSGAASPSESYIELNDDNIPRPVKQNFFSRVLQIPVCHLQYSKVHQVLFHYQELFLAICYVQFLVGCLLDISSSLLVLIFNHNQSINAQSIVFYTSKESIKIDSF